MEEHDHHLPELPRANRNMVEQYVRANEDQATEVEVQQRVAEVLMADALGRAIHQAKVVGGPWPAPCMRRCPDYPDEEIYEVIPYGWGDETECLCEAMALHLIELMKAQTTVDELTGRFVGPETPVN